MILSWVPASLTDLVHANCMHHEAPVPSLLSTGWVPKEPTLRVQSTLRVTPAHCMLRSHPAVSGTEQECVFPNLTSEP